MTKEKDAIVAYDFKAELALDARVERLLMIKEAGVVVSLVLFIILRSWIIN